MSQEIKKQWDLPSQSDPKKTYKVTLYEDGSYACTCPHWIYRKKECKHIRQCKEGKKQITLIEGKLKNTNIDSLLERCLTLGKANKYEDAFNQIDKLLELDPENNTAFFIRSVIYERQGNISNDFEKATKVNHLETKDDVLKTIKQLDKALEVYHHELTGLSIRGLLLSELRKVCDKEEFMQHLDYHIRVLEEALEFHDKITDYELGYKFIWHNLSSFTRNAANKKEMVLEYCSDESAIISFFATFGQLGIYNQLKVCYDFLLEHGAKGLCILNNIGIALSKLLNEEQAINSFNKALEITPNYIYALNNLGAVEDSVEHFDEVLKLDNENLASCFNKSFYLYKSTSDRDLEEALKYCEKALKIAPDDKYCWYLHGSIHQLSGNKELAIESYNKALEFAPNSEEILRTQGELLIEVGNLEEALKFLNKATELEPGNMYLWEDKISIYRNLKDEMGEYKCYERMLEECPVYTSALLGKGRLLVDRGMYDEAVKLLDKVAGGENWDSLWPYAIFHKARAAALQNKKNETFFLIKATIRAGAALGDFREDQDLKELINKTPEFEKYKSIEEFKSILAHDYNTKEETDKFWNDIKKS